jgi:hypothetical protein
LEVYIRSHQFTRSTACREDPLGLPSAEWVQYRLLSNWINWRNKTMRYWTHAVLDPCGIGPMRYWTHAVLDPCG